MSKHWNPDDVLLRVREERAAQAKPRWPNGATAGLVLVAAACLGVAAVLYHVAGPRDVFAP
jgi:hypothetical protein